MKQFFILALIIPLLSCNLKKEKTLTRIFPDDEKLVSSWNQFKKALCNSDTITLLALTNECVSSSGFCDAHDNDSSLLVSREIFLKNCFGKIFDNVMISCLADSNKVSAHFDENGWFTDDSCITKNKEVSNPRIANILIQLPYKHDGEGVSELLSFVETKNGYKLCGTLRIP